MKSMEIASSFDSTLLHGFGKIPRYTILLKHRRLKIDGIQTSRVGWVNWRKSHPRDIKSDDRFKICITIDELSTFRADFYCWFSYLQFSKWSLVWRVYHMYIILETISLQALVSFAPQWTVGSSGAASLTSELLCLAERLVYNTTYRAIISSSGVELRSSSIWSRCFSRRLRTRRSLFVVL